MAFTDALTDRLGPVPVWGWGLGLGAGLSGWFWWRRRKSAGSSAGDAASDPNKTAAAGANGYASGAVPADPFPIYDSQRAAGGGGSGETLTNPSGLTGEDLAAGIGAGLGDWWSSIGGTLPISTPAPIDVAPPPVVDPPPAPATAPAPPAVVTPTPATPPPTPGPPKGTILWTGKSEPVPATINGLIRSRYPGATVRWESRKRGGNLGFVAVVI